MSDWYHICTCEPAPCKLPTDAAPSGAHEAAVLETEVLHLQLLARALQALAEEQRRQDHDGRCVCHSPRSRWAAAVSLRIFDANALDNILYQVCASKLRARWSHQQQRAASDLIDSKSHIVLCLLLSLVHGLVQRTTSGQRHSQRRRTQPQRARRARRSAPLVRAGWSSCQRMTLPHVAPRHSSRAAWLDAQPVGLPRKCVCLWVCLEVGG